MRIAAIFVIFLALFGCTNKAEKQYQTGPWKGPFGTQMGITKQQIERYTILAGIDSDGQTFAGQALPDNYGINFDRIIYRINSVEGLCALSLTSSSDDDVALIRQYIEKVYGNPTIERVNKYVTWDKKNMLSSPVIVINYAKGNNLIKIFYPNYDRCKLL